MMTSETCPRCLGPACSAFALPLSVRWKYPMLVNECVDRLLARAQAAEASLAAQTAVIEAFEQGAAGIYRLTSDILTNKAKLAAVRALVAPPEPHAWQPVPGSLPPNDGLVEIRTADGVEARGCYDFDNFDDSDWPNPPVPRESQGWWHAVRRGWGHTDIVAWRPLPRPRHPVLDRILCIIDGARDETDAPAR